MGVKDRLERMPVIGTALAVQERYTADAGNQFAAAIAFFGFLSLFPIILLALAVAGYVLANNPSARGEFQGLLTGAIPGLGGQFRDTVNTIIDNRAATGVVGLVGLLFSGLRALDAATVVTSSIYRVDLADLGFVEKRGRQLAGLVGLGLLALAGTAAGSLAGVDTEGLAQGAVIVGGTGLSIGLDFVLFAAAYRVFAAAEGPALGDLWPGALLAGTGWTALKVAGSWLAARQAANAEAVYGALASLIAAMLLLYLAGRLYVYGAELNATLNERRHGSPLGVAGATLDDVDGEGGASRSGAAGITTEREAVDMADASRTPQRHRAERTGADGGADGEPVLTPADPTDPASLRPAPWASLRPALATTLMIGAVATATRLVDPLDLADDQWRPG